MGGMDLEPGRPGRADRRVALVADIHGNLPALEATAADLQARGLSRVVNLGDHVSGPLWPRETAAFLMQREWLTIAGNHDRQVAHDDPGTLGPSDRYARESLTPAQHAWLRGLPATAALETADVFLCHGIPAEDRKYLLETPDGGRLRPATPDEIARRLGPPGTVTASLVACGHSHIPRLVHGPAETPIVNPGSVGLPAYQTEGRYAHVSETGSPSARYAVIEPARAGWSVVFVALEYDWTSAAARADANGRGDWAWALRTGYARS